MKVIEIKKGLVIEEVCKSQTNIFFDIGLYYIGVNSIRRFVEERIKPAKSVDVYFGGINHGCIVIIQNLAMENKVDLGKIVVDIIDYISQRSII